MPVSTLKVDSENVDSLVTDSKSTSESTPPSLRRRHLFMDQARPLKRTKVHTELFTSEYDGGVIQLARAEDECRSGTCPRSSVVADSGTYVCTTCGLVNGVEYDSSGERFAKEGTTRVSTHSDRARLVDLLGLYTPAPVDMSGTPVHQAGRGNGVERLLCHYNLGVRTIEAQCRMHHLAPLVCKKSLELWKKTCVLRRDRGSSRAQALTELKARHLEETGVCDNALHYAKVQAQGDKTSAVYLAALDQNTSRKKRHTYEMKQTKGMYGGCHREVEDREAPAVLLYVLQTESMAHGAVDLAETCDSTVMELEGAVTRLVHNLDLPHVNRYCQVLCHARRLARSFRVDDAFSWGLEELVQGHARAVGQGIPDRLSNTEVAGVAVFWLMCRDRRDYVRSNAARHSPSPSCRRGKNGRMPLIDLRQGQHQKPVVSRKVVRPRATCDVLQGLTLDQVIARCHTNMAPVTVQTYTRYLRDEMPLADRLALLECAPRPLVHMDPLTRLDRKARARVTQEVLPVPCAPAIALDPWPTDFGLDSAAI